MSVPHYWRLMGLSVGLTMGCYSSGSFTCQDDTACEGVGPAAQCEPNGYCSYEDLGCDSGRRYGDLAGGGLGGQCVGESATSGPTTDSGPTSVASLDTADVDDTADPDDTADTGGSDDTTDSLGDSDDTGPPDTGMIPADWWDCDWAGRRSLLIDAPGLDETLSDVPVLIVLDDTRIDPTIMAPDGHDLRFVADDGTVLSSDIEQWQPSGLSWAWVTVPELPPAGTTLTMYYGNPTAPSLDESAAWSEYVGVWHMDGTLTDATDTSTIDLADSDTIEGQAGHAQMFSSDIQGISVAPGRSVGGLFSEGGTITAMVRLSDWGSGGRGPIVSRDDGSDNGDGGWVFQVDGNPQSLRFARGFSTNRLTWLTPDGSLGLHQWFHVAVTYDDVGVPTLYVDGVALPVDESGQGNGSPDPDLAPLMRIGGDPLTSDSGFGGRIDEVRLARVLRSPAWIAVQSASLRDELVTYGAPQSCPTPP